MRAETVASHVRSTVDLFVNAGYSLDEAQEYFRGVGRAIAACNGHELLPEGGDVLETGSPIVDGNCLVIGFSKDVSRAKEARHQALRQVAPAAAAPDGLPAIFEPQTSADWAQQHTAPANEEARIDDAFDAWQKLHKAAREDHHKAVLESQAGADVLACRILALLDAVPLIQAELAVRKVTSILTRVAGVFDARSRMKASFRLYPMPGGRDISSEAR